MRLCWMSSVCGIRLDGSDRGRYHDLAFFHPFHREVENGLVHLFTGMCGMSGYTLHLHNLAKGDWRTTSLWYYRRYGIYCTAFKLLRRPLSHFCLPARGTPSSPLSVNWTKATASGPHAVTRTTRILLYIRDSPECWDTAEHAARHRLSRDGCLPEATWSIDVND